MEIGSPRFHTGIENTSIPILIQGLPGITI
jgi:hypothetical protein